ncbi:response regulator [Patescibacteria group bacterium]|nr:MAG: response regulator [Patescibacteria group bacterium]
MNKKLKILLVDDDSDTRDMYAAVFEKAGFQVLEAKDGLVGVEVATKDLPDVIFSGIIMPRMDGYTMMEALKKNVATASIPVVISSHLGREEDQQKANLHGAKDFIVRGFTTPNQVVQRVKKILAKGGVYHIEFSPYSLDAQEMARELHLPENYQCLECHERMVLTLRPQDRKELVFDATLYCPKCGWESK